MTRGYVGIGIEHGKYPENTGALLRAAHCFGVDFVFTVGRRYEDRHPTDTTDATNHVPVFHADTFDELLDYDAPRTATVVGVDGPDEPSGTPLPEYDHPERALYVLGAEDWGLDDERLASIPVVTIPTQFSLNVAMAGACVLYDREAKRREWLKDSLLDLAGL